MKAQAVTNKLSRILNRNNIFTNLNPTENRSLRVSNTIGVIKYDEIRQVIDTLGKINYTFRVEHSESDYKTFFNLILQEKEGYSSVKLLKYVMTEEFAQLYNQNLKLDNFRGIVSSEVIVSDMPCN